MKSVIAVLSGSFDPVTVGHLDLLRRGVQLFDRVWVAVSANAEKHGLFSPEERVYLLQLALTEWPAELAGRVSIAPVEGLLSDFCREKGASVLLRGARGCVDFDYEHQLAGIMKRFSPTLETVILPADPALSSVSSTYVRELLRYRCPLNGAVPAGAMEEMERLYRGKA